MGCAAYATALNETATSMSMDMSMTMPVSATMTSMSMASSTSAAASSGGSSTPIGPIVGGVVGGIVAVVVILCGTFLLYKKRKFGSVFGDHAETIPAPYTAPTPGHQSVMPTGDTKWNGQPQPSFMSYNPASTGVPSYAQSVSSPGGRQNIVSSATDYDFSMLDALNQTPPPAFNPYAQPNRMSLHPEPMSEVGHQATGTIDGSSSAGDTVKR